MIHNNTGKVINKLLLGDKQVFGYDGMRIIRGVLIRELATAGRERGVEILCNKKFIGVTSESKTEGVAFQFADGSRGHANLLVGADGIHSRVRSNVFPDAVEPTYIGQTVVYASCARDRITSDTAVPLGMYIGDAGAVMLGPHVPDDADYVVGLQKQYPDLGRKGWDELSKDRKMLRAFMEEGKNRWPVHVQSAMENARDESLGLWAMHVLPKLDSWVSSGGRAVLLADAAHAMPPTGGQGANMAFEDSDTLGAVLGWIVKLDGKSLDESLDFWQKMRRKRIELVLEMAMQWNKMRKPAVEREKMQKGEAFEGAATEDARIEQMRWLFDGVAAQRRQVEAWAAGNCFD